MKLVKGLKSVSGKKTTATSAPVESKTIKSANKPAEVEMKSTPVAAKPTAAEPKSNAVVVQPAKPSAQPLTIEAKIDVGFGNGLYLRGEGQGLSWNQGIPLTCVDRSTWTWSSEGGDKLKFKLLINDIVWSKGEDLVASPGEKLQIAPSF
jgi:hypothetical protein